MENVITIPRDFKRQSGLCQLPGRGIDRSTCEVCGRTYRCKCQHIHFPRVINTSTNLPYFYAQFYPHGPNNDPKTPGCKDLGSISRPWHLQCPSTVHQQTFNVLERCLGQPVKLFHTCVLDGRFLSAAMDKESSCGVNQEPYAVCNLKIVFKSVTHVLPWQGIIILLKKWCFWKWRSL